jgi:hypothetical protein
MICQISTSFISFFSNGEHAELCQSVLGRSVLQPSDQRKTGSLPQFRTEHGPMLCDLSIASELRDYTTIFLRRTVPGANLENRKCCS